MIDFNEFVALFFDRKTLDVNTLHQNTLSMFAKLDRDHSSSISFDELCRLFGPTMSRQLLRELFDEIDCDHSGTIDVTEFTTFVKSL